MWFGRLFYKLLNTLDDVTFMLFVTFNLYAMLRCGMEDYFINYKQIHL